MTMRALPFSGIFLWVTGCFQDVSSPSSCPEGARGCPCLDLRCEDGLACQDGTCVAEEADSASESSEGSESSAAASSSEEESASGSSEASSSSDEGTSDDAEGSTTSTSGGTSTTGAGESTTTSSEGSTSESAETTEESSTGTMDLCGNGALDAGEACDSVPGCEDDCSLTHYDCNPLNNAPCPDDFKCSVIEEDSGEILAVCLPFMDPPPGQLHEGNCYYGGRHDEWCDVGLACALISAASVCYDNGTNCCVEFCDLTDADFTCAYPDDACIPFMPSSAPPGLAQLGFCGRP